MFHNYVILRVMAHETLLVTQPLCMSVTLVTLRVVFIPYINCLFIVARLTLHFVRYITANESVTIYDKLHVTPRITLHISRFKALRVTLSQLMSRLMRHVIFCISKMFDHFITFRKKNADLIADALEFMYTPWPDNSDKYALRSQLVDSIGDNAFTKSPIFTASMPRSSCTSLRTAQRMAATMLNGWAWHMGRTFHLTSVSRCCRISLNMMKPIETSVSLSWHCMQTSPTSVIQRRNQSAVLCGISTTQAAGPISE